ncbi:MAG: Unknown protein [uncultured Sulfurovum sp.]|uniref:Uncharacterized protein n=1 Tax=uncultured Sulfurovum sp. TaxID=269237 RepID=A0A6S6T9S5_9BACT|nr:MAG: Unknown protein [uncultured Sulfurovum sp.]
MINKNELMTLIEPHFKKDLKSDNYEIKTIKANKLLTYSRFDLAFKLLYLEMKDKDVEFSKNIYREHIRAFSLGKFTEPGNENKDNIDKFISDFDKTFENIKINGFDSSKTLIPLSKNASIANGAHRVASSIYFDKEVDYIQLDTSDHIYDYKFFYGRNVPSDMLDVVATKFVEYAENIHVAFIWSTAQGHDREIENIIPNIVYRKEIKLTPNGAHNLLSQIYYGEEWLGRVENNFKGAEGKLVECFKNFNPVRVIAFQANNLDEVLKIKDRVRELFNVGKHSIHITDTKEEAIRTVRVVFNENSIHFLNYAKPNKYLSTHTKIDEFKKFVVKNDLDSNDLLIDSSFISSCYGLREAKDTDFFCSDNEKIKVDFDDINLHDEALRFYHESKQELIYNPKNYFYFNELKFISFSQLYKMKTNRAEEKDINDCKMMEALVENSTLHQIISQQKQKIYYMKIKIRFYFVEILKKIKLYEATRSLYRFIKR